ncbi:MAG: hypothetical protein N2B06_00250 [Clostridium sp.]
MNKNNLEETKKSNKYDLTKGNVSNIDMINMYNMPNMISGPSDATLEEKELVKARSLESKGTYKK